MSCDVRSCEELSSAMPCNGMECYELKTPLFSKQVLCSTKYYSRTTLYYKVLFQYNSVLQSTTPVLLQYYSVLRSTTPVLLCTTKYYSSTQVLKSTTPVLQNTTPILLRTTKSTPVLLLCTTKYYSSTTPILLCTTKYYSSTSPYYKVLLCTTKYCPSTTLYYKVLVRTTKYYSSTTLYYKVTAVLLCTKQYYSLLQRATSAQVMLQHHQMLRLQRKIALMIYPLEA